MGVTQNNVDLEEGTLEIGMEYRTVSGVDVPLVMTILEKVKIIIMATASVGFKSREDQQKQMELDEARKAGLAPAEVDEDGKEINPHIPRYMSSAPWYLDADKPSLKHQRKWKWRGQDI